MANDTPESLASALAKSVEAAKIRGDKNFNVGDVLRSLDTGAKQFTEKGDLEMAAFLQKESDILKDKFGIVTPKKIASS